MIPMDTHTQYNRLKHSAKKRGIKFDLTHLDIMQLDYPISCPILGIPLTYNVGKVDDNSYSIDRVDSSKGYSIDNIEVISFRANKLKSDATITEIIALYNYYSNK